MAEKVSLNSQDVTFSCPAKRNCAARTAARSRLSLFGEAMRLPWNVPKKVGASILCQPRTTISVVKHLLIVYHSKTGNTQQLVQAAVDGLEDPDLEPVALRCLSARDAGPEDLLWADGLVLATPENFGYMSGAIKDFFDRTFYEVEGKLNPLPYTLLVSAGNDGAGAVRSIERIANGYPLKQIAAPLIVKGIPSAEDLQKSAEAVMVLAAGLALGMF